MTIRTRALHSRNDEYVELEVVHYPLNTCHRAIQASEKWKKNAAKAKGDYLKPASRRTGTRRCAVIS